jgi:DNA polymerase-4
VSDRAKAKDLSGRTVTLKLKRANFTQITRRHSLTAPTQTADRIYREARALMDMVQDPGPFPADRGRHFRSGPGGRSRRHPPICLTRTRHVARAAERATDAIRARFGKDAIMKGRSLR